MTIKRLRLQLIRSSLGLVAWANLLVLSGSQVALFVDVATGTHGYCSEKDGFVHHVDEQAATLAGRSDDHTLALRSGQKKNSADDQLDHCGALGSGLRPALTPIKACTPRIDHFEKAPKRPEFEAKPIVVEPVYALAPKTSPPALV